MALNSIEGLTYRADFITPQTAQTLLKHIDSSVWLDDLKRRVQHYGYKYDYKKRSVDASMRLGALPVWSQDLLQLFIKQKIITSPFDQLIINEYLPGQGITDHIDCPPCFQDTIASLSLGSGCIMRFTNTKTKQILEQWLAPNSLIVLKGAARYNWKHGIAGRQSDIVNGRRIKRQRRVSLTFRHIKLAEPPTK